MGTLELSVGSRQAGVVSAAVRHRLATMIGLGVVAALLGVKVVLAWRISVHWDEFFFLSLVHSLLRGELTHPLQTIHTHLFQWLPAIANDEVGQVIAGRLVMLACLAASAHVIWRLALRCASPAAAVMAPISYLGLTTVARHGGSFRVDTLLATLSLMVVFLMLHCGRRRGAVLLAGLLLGIAGALTVKAALLVPVLVALLVAIELATAKPWRDRLLAVARQLLAIGVPAAILAASLLALHRLSIGEGSEPITSAAIGDISKTVFVDPGLFWTYDIALAIVLSDAFQWSLLLIGAFAALQRRLPLGVAAIVALLPIVYYRNCFPYYYTVMLAFGVLLIPLAVDRLIDDLRSRFGRIGALAGIAVLVGGVGIENGTNLRDLWSDEQSHQQQLVSAVHQIFPDPVPYIDHSGMIASFPKVNFLMSGWGVELYMRRGEAFMRALLDRHRPPLLVVNHEFLDPRAVLHRALLPEDRALMEQFYLPYWGPIRVAGAQVNLDSSRSVDAALPFPGSYRIEADGPVMIDGRVRHPGDVITAGSTTASLSVGSVAGSTTSATVRFVWAAARPPPAISPSTKPLYESK